MTPEELQRTMEFIAQHQAKFASDIQMLFEADKELRSVRSSAARMLGRRRGKGREARRRKEGEKRAIKKIVFY